MVKAQRKGRWEEFGESVVSRGLSKNQTRTELRNVGMRVKPYASPIDPTSGNSKLDWEDETFTFSGYKGSHNFHVQIVFNRQDQAIGYSIKEFLVTE